MFRKLKEAVSYNVHHMSDMINLELSKIPDWLAVNKTLPRLWLDNIRGFS